MTTTITTDLAGEIGVTPRIIRLSTTDSFSTITTAGYLNQFQSQGYTFYPNDVILASYGTNSATTQLFTLSISNNIITMLPDAGNVTLPVTSGDFAIFDGTSGTLKDGGFSPTDSTKSKVAMLASGVTPGHMALYFDTAGTLTENQTTAINGGSIQAGLSGTAGSLYSYPPSAASGALYLSAANNSGNFDIGITNASHGQSTVYSIADVKQATGSLLNCKVSADPGANLISFDVAITFSQLASGGTAIIFPSSGTKQYKIRALQLSATTNFGGGGDRGAYITDGTTHYSIIAAANLQTLANSVWGNTGLPLPSTLSADINTSTQPGASLYMVYQSGTTDYTSGALVLSGIVERVA